MCDHGKGESKTRGVWKKSVRTGEGKAGRFHSCPVLEGNGLYARPTCVFAFPLGPASPTFVEQRPLQLGAEEKTPRHKDGFVNGDRLVL